MLGIYVQKDTWTTWVYKSEKEQIEHWNKRLKKIMGRKNDNAG